MMKPNDREVALAGWMVAAHINGAYASDEQLAWAKEVLATSKEVPVVPTMRVIKNYYRRKRAHTVVEAVFTGECHPQCATPLKHAGPCTNRVPAVGDLFTDEWNNRLLHVASVHSTIVKGPFIGRMIGADDGVGYDCFWSHKNQRFQYHTDEI
jgi:hypothetical protein